MRNESKAAVTKHYIKIDVKDAGGDRGVLRGYGAVYGNVDQAGDIIAHGAFAKSIKDRAASNKKFPFLYQHSSSEPIGVIEEIKEDRNGLAITVKLNLDTQRGRETYSLIKMGAIDGLSVGFETVKDEIDERGIRIIREARLWEVSAVTFPCNTQARIESVKSKKISFGGDMTQNKISKSIARLKSLIAKADADELEQNDFEETLEEVISLLQTLGGSTMTDEDEPQKSTDGEVEEKALEGEEEAEDSAETAQDDEPQDTASEDEDEKYDDEDEKSEDENDIVNELEALLHSIEDLQKVI